MKGKIMLFLSALAGFFMGIVIFEKMNRRIRNSVQIMSDKHLKLFLMMNQWVRVKQERKSIADYLKCNGYKNIAIYGMSYVGESLLNELKNTGIVIKYGIDQKADELYSKIRMCSPEDKLEDVDAIIVTSVFFIDEVKKNLSLKVSCPIISLDDILNEI